MTHHSPERDRLKEAHSGGYIFEAQDVERAQLDGIELEGASWRDVSLKRSNLNEANLTRVFWQDVDVANTGLRGGRLNRSWMDSVRFTLCDLAQVNLSGACLRDVAIEESPAPFSTFDDTLLNRVSMRVVDLQSASMRSAALLHSQFRDERLGGANMMNVDLSGSVIIDCSLSNANLQGANLSGAILLGVDLRGANLEGADLTDAVGYDVQGGGRLTQANDPREAHYLLHQRAAQLGAMGRLAVELAWSSLIDGTQSIQGNRDIAAQLLRQRNLSFADLVRFLKERFAHSELDKMIIDGDQVGIRTDTGTIPMTSFGGSSRMGQGTAPRRNAPPNPDATGMDAFRRPSSSGRPGGGGGAASSGAGSAPASAASGGRATPDRGSRRQAAQEPPQNPEEVDVFADSRFGLIDLDEDEPI